jgi:hypothetical protein
MRTRAVSGPSEPSPSRCSAVSFDPGTLPRSVQAVQRDDGDRDRLIGRRILERENPPKRAPKLLRAVVARQLGRKP